MEVDEEEKQDEESKDVMITADDDEERNDNDAKLSACAQYLCDYCRKDISVGYDDRQHHWRISNRGRDSVELNIDESNDHKNTHAYRVIDHVTEAIFDDDWGADEELMLLEGIERYGLGNWQDVAQHLGVKNKNKQRCEAHYHAVYLNSRISPLPDPTVVLNPSTYPKNTIDYELPQGPEHVESRQETVLQGKLNAETVAAGFRPKRGEFDTEFDNAAEEILGDMEFHDDDSSLLRRLQLKVLGVFHRKLDARHERKRFALKHGLLYSNRDMKHRSKEFKQLYADLKVFARFHTQEEHLRFVEDVYRERVLIRDIEELRERRANGVRTFLEERIYVEEKTIRDMWIANATDAVESEKTKGMSRHDAATAAVADLIRRRPEIPESHVVDGLDISHMECVELLNTKERVLCCEMKLIPRHYNLIKSKIVLESYTHGWTSRDHARQYFDIDPAIVDAVYNLIVEMGIVNTTQPDYPPPPYDRQPPPTKASKAMSPKTSFPETPLSEVELARDASVRNTSSSHPSTPCQ